MRLSMIRLVIISVAFCWAIVLVVLGLYLRSQTWTGDEARTYGVHLAYALLEETPETSRAERLRRLQANFVVDLSLISSDELERRIGRMGAPGEEIAVRSSLRHAWYFIVFEDGSGALAAGPVNPAIPTGVVPIGLLLVVFLLPLIAGMVAFRFGRGVAKVERANQALTVGDLTVRVDDDRGPSDKLAESFNAMAERVELLVRSRDELVQAVSHELGSPLSRLRFQVELLESPSEERRRERAQAMARELDALDALVAELLNYVESGDVELNWQSFDPRPGLVDLAELAGHEFPEQHSVGVELKLPPGIHVFADERLFLRTVENILRNAVQHAKSNVVLELTADGDQVWVTVHDDGAGIPVAMREKVLNPFFRVEAERNHKAGGVGLGLAIVGRITQQHGGRVVVAESSLGGARIATVWSRATPSED